MKQNNLRQEKPENTFDLFLSTTADFFQKDKTFEINVEYHR